MKLNWRGVGCTVVIIAGLIGWGLYAREHNRYQVLLSQQPTPVPASTIYGLFESADAGTITVGVQQVGNEPGTLTVTKFNVSEDVVVLRRDAAANEYVSAFLSDLQAGTWLEIDTDSSGTVTSVTAGQ